MIKEYVLKEQISKKEVEWQLEVESIFIETIDSTILMGSVLKALMSVGRI